MAWHGPSMHSLPTVRHLPCGCASETISSAQCLPAEWPIALPLVDPSGIVTPLWELPLRCLRIDSHGKALNWARTPVHTWTCASSTEAEAVLPFGILGSKSSWGAWFQLGSFILYGS